MFGPIFKYIGFSYNKNICTFHLQNLITIVKIAQLTWFYVHLQNLIVQKSCGSRNFDFFLPFLKYLPSKFQKLIFFKFDYFLSLKEANSWKNLLGDVMSSISRHWPSFYVFLMSRTEISILQGPETRVRILQDFSKIWSALYHFLATVMKGPFIASKRN